MSKELEALNRLYDKYAGDDEFLSDDKLFSVIEKGLKALEITRKLGFIDVEEINYEKSASDYAKYNLDLDKKELLTEDDFKLLKEVFGE